MRNRVPALLFNKFGHRGRMSCLSCVCALEARRGSVGCCSGFSQRHTHDKCSTFRTRVEYTRSYNLYAIIGAIDRARYAAALTYGSCGFQLKF